MNCKRLNFNDIASVPQLIKDFLSEEEFSSQRFSLHNALKQAEIKHKTFSPEQRETLHKVLVEQMGSLHLSDKQRENLDLIAQNNVFTITTGHQLNLFSGASFFVYKILQTIKTAEFLNQHSEDKKFVPVFWLATEDHDFDEIQSFKTKNHQYQITGKAGGAVGRIKIEENHFIQDFEREFKDDVYATELILWLKEAYKLGNSLTQATKILVNRLFGERGILMIDGDDKALKEQMREIFTDEIKNQTLKKSTENTIQNLTEKYGKVQVNPREINLFYLSETRDRIEKEGNQYKIVDKNWVLSEEKILEKMENISPNAVMRPIYQEKILPNIAYIGGNAEIMYWLELKDYFRKMQVSFPLLVPRNSLLFLTEKIGDKIERLGLNIHHFFENYTEVMRDKLLNNSELLEVINQKEDEIKKIFELLKEKSSLTDKTFRNLVEAEQTRQLKSYTRMKKRLLRAEKIKQNEKYTRMSQLYFEVHHNGVWQERVLNFSVFYAQNGQAWIQKCYENIDVEKSELVVSFI
ncbi:MAG: bacillithiol biosynthesis cysteine-adding enzyme BshC [Flavobacteriaceae bacterium]|nr:bacillithiol biosynthesis cysteine-adding enzyme BshC [Flavobacteriaceae bacterium]